MHTQMADGFVPSSASLNPAAVANPCRWCGADLIIEWADVSTYAEINRVIPGAVTCPTPGCSPHCPTCRSTVGDIHGPNCGEIIAGKLGDPQPCTITRDDCGPRLVT
jgi:hypothetical protein